MGHEVRLSMGLCVCVVVLEECPKWAALREVLEEINGYLEEEPGEGGVSATPSVLVAAADDKTCSQLKEVGHLSLSILLLWCVASCRPFAANNLALLA